MFSYWLISLNTYTVCVLEQNFEPNHAPNAIKPKQQQTDRIPPIYKIILYDSWMFMYFYTYKAISPKKYVKAE